MPMQQHQLVTRSMQGLILHRKSVCKRELKVVALPCMAIRRRGCKLIGNGDVNLATVNFIKHAEIAYPAP